MHNWITPSLLLLTFCFPALLSADEPENKMKIAYADVESAPADFSHQGEYVGEVTTDDGQAKYGLQLVSRGDENFEFRVYVGGLPGDGWKGKETPQGTGKIDGDHVLLTSSESDVVGIVNEGKIRIVNDKGFGDELGVLEKQSRKSPTLGAKPAEGAVVLFDGTSGDHFENGQVTEEGFLKQGVTSKKTFKDCHLHIEFKLPFMPFALGQQRGNSGCYLQGRYEVQMLDSFGLAGLDNECGAIYATQSPSINMCSPPLTWQTYDIDFTAPVYNDKGTKVEPATITVRHNGVLVQDKTPVEGPTRAAPFAESDEPGPLFLQDHGNPVLYRNIWLVEK
ncbi:hypothetical protein Pla110_05440 [Polystyrenella longa]|uniref:3-keto-alpha-glucoside-1,2-lyase/3-keto-2-hydroxy-glucal hydratase domain-containing protein n=1 Tax=Polystyrenella longa TaxID=2528007 RepID=A0A518CHY3_9PLAN|nr:DUF1080 domain-containing protein [Polystyrenella longa]QDU78840.1 hypothetical protein Pla110_05440 [Polystyrenella longa]